MNSNSYKQLEERDLLIAELRKQLKEAKRDNELIMLNLTQCGQQLAASQAREPQLREALEVLLEVTTYKPKRHHAIEMAMNVLDQPSDTTALEYLIQKAGEIMQEKCAMLCEDKIAESIHALPCVKLDDLK